MPQPTESTLPHHSEISDTSQAPLDILDPFNADLDMHNMVEHPCNHKPSARVQGYAAALVHIYSDKIPQFYTAFLAGISQSSHRNQLPPPPASWHALKKHPHAEGFRSATRLEYKALKLKGTFKIIRRP